MGSFPRIVVALPRFEPMAVSPAFQGFDRDVLPRWQMVPFGGWKIVFLDNGGPPGPPFTVASLPPGIVDLVETPRSPAVLQREFKIVGKLPGHTLVQVFSPNGTTVIGQLQVVVKEQALYKIAFHLVTDGLFETTVRPHSIATSLNLSLNTIFGFQANVMFEPPQGAGTLSLRTTLHELVSELSEGRRVPRRGWDELDKEGDRTAHLNVFFMKYHGSPDRFPSQVIQNETNIVFGDGMAADNVLAALAHRIGLFLGCSVTYKDRHKHHVMHVSREDGTISGPAGVHFISRDAANAMNP
jgi:hypothetical protein